MDKDDDDHWRVNYNAAIALVVGDLQKRSKDQEKQIKALQEENKQLRSMIEQITERLDKIEKA
jgi:predicted RNase H-like nuclease (RuvC/YqgF family)